MKKTALRGFLAGLAFMGMPYGQAADTIPVGMVNVQSGPAAGLGTELKAGSAAYFDKINNAGGVNGYQIRLISYDDGYEPEKTSTLTNKLINDDKVMALFGFVGTPTSKAAVPAASNASIPFIAPFTGAEFLRNPVNKVVFNVRASYFDETEGLVEHFVRDLGLRKIGVFIQDDAYGEAGKGGVNRALHKRGLTMAGEGRYKRNSEDISAGLAALKAVNPEVVIMVGTYKACAEFVKKARASNFNPKFANVSFVGTSEFIKAAGKDGEGVYISQVVPSPTDTSVPVVKKYQDDLKAAGITNYNYTSLEGYINAVVFVEALKKVSGTITKEEVIKSFDTLDMDLGGYKVKFSASDHQGSKQIFFTQVKNGEAAPISNF